MTIIGHRIFICGMPGSGKSFLGRKLAEKLKADFIDLDEVIETSQRNNITSIFRDKGEDYFREIESQSLKSVIEKIPIDNGLIISLGGGTPCFHDNMKLIKVHGISLFVDTPLRVIANRLTRRNEVAKRPLISGEDQDEVYTEMQARYEVRKPYYNQADIKIKGDESYESISLLIRSFIDKPSDKNLFRLRK